MAPACVLLDRLVTFVDHNPAVESTQSEDDNDEEFGAATDGVDSLGEVPSWEEMEEGIAAHLRAMTPAPQVEEPPRVSRLSMVRPALSSSDDNDPNLQFGLQLDAGYVAAAHGRFVALYAGPYRPATSSVGCYLVYDAARRSGDSLATVPGIPFSASYTSVGDGTIVMAAPAPDDDGADFVLAELLTMFRAAPPQAVLCLWRTTTQGARAGCWEKKAGRLPGDACRPKHAFTAHTAFSFNTSVCCWVDLRHGLLLCDSASPGDDAEFFFVPLPAGYAIDTTHSPGHQQLRARDFRSVSCVAGTIMFVSLDGYLQQRRRQPDTSVRLTTWRLDLHKDLSLPAKWTQETSTLIHDLFPQCPHTLGSRPGTMKHIMCPVLCTQQSYLVYLVLAGTETVVDDGHHQVNRVCYLLAVDTRRGKVVSSAEYNSNGGFWPHRLLGSEFSAYIQ